MTIAELIHRLSHLDVEASTFVLMETEVGTQFRLDGVDVESHPDGGAGPNTIYISVTPNN